MIDLDNVKKVIRDMGYCINPAVFIDDDVANLIRQLNDWIVDIETISKKSDSNLPTRTRRQHLKLIALRDRLMKNFTKNME